MNSVQLVGRVGQDPQIFVSEGGKRVARVSLATTERGFTRRDGTKVEDRTEWHNLVFFGSITQVIEKYVKKGELISVRGSIHYDKYEDKDKVVRYTTDMYRIKFCHWYYDLDMEDTGCYRVMKFKKK